MVLRTAQVQSGGMIPNVTGMELPPRLLAWAGMGVGRTLRTAAWGRALGWGGGSGLKLYMEILRKSN